ncbi:MAG: permease [endosymbiont of Galathealinum brachiosum]|uniref:Permease n=1 Tax=endosymbiont of Galathealinum brachiosum TaxID=2200906 RepID=A0A370DFB8_9GAMM|nr:MAG: permease [endosymbiont of Galathealinum brachiosum]
MGDLIQQLGQNIWAVYLDTAIWLLFGLIAAGLVKAYVPEDAMKRWLGGSGFSAVGRAALFGAPVPLCSCSVLPAAIGLHRAGASKEATVSFLISTPETSIDSVAVTYALMGPVMAIYRPVSALVSAIVTGMMVAFVKDEDIKQSTHTVDINKDDGSCSAESDVSSCCSSADSEQSTCCESSLKHENDGKLKRALRYAATDLLDDISSWMAFGIVFAGIMMTLIPDGWLAQWGQGLTAMLVMLLVGIPMYICAVASTPVAAGLLVAGVSPGAVLVFLLVGPATNIAGIMLVKKELGNRVTMIYLAGISIVSLVMGLLLEWGLSSFSLQIDTSLLHQHNFMPYELSLAGAILLLALIIPKIRNTLIPFFSK